MNKKIIYAVEDDEGICELYQGAFEDDYIIKTFANGKDFFQAFNHCKPNLIILDVMLPDMDGFSILTEIRKKDNLLPVLIVSAKSDELSSLKGLNKGADDYITKPFSLIELMARVKTNLRRSERASLSYGNITVNCDAFEIYCKGEKMILSLKEYNLLKYLVERANITVSREELFKNVWGEDFLGETRTLDMHIASLREKLSALGENCIVTVRGIGYRLS